MEFLASCLSLFHTGGPVMYFLALCSLIVVSIGVERFFYYRSMSADAQVFIANLKPLLEKRHIDEAKNLCEQTTGLISQVTARGLQSYQIGNNIKTALEGEAMLAASRLREYLNYLSAIVTLSPLLGLLGTVIGMISSFSILNIKSGEPLAITGGIGEALVATAAGLSVAILALVIHTYFSHRLDQLLTDTEQVCTIVVNSFSQENCTEGKS